MTTIKQSDNYDYRNRSNSNNNDDDNFKVLRGVY